MRERTSCVKLVFLIGLRALHATQRPRWTRVVRSYFACPPSTSQGSPAWVPQLNTVPSVPHAAPQTARHPAGPSRRGGRGRRGGKRGGLPLVRREDPMQLYYYYPGVGEQVSRRPSGCSVVMTLLRLPGLAPRLEYRLEIAACSAPILVPSRMRRAARPADSPPRLHHIGRRALRLATSPPPVQGRRRARQSRRRRTGAAGGRHALRGGCRCVCRGATSHLPGAVPWISSCRCKIVLSTAWR